MGKFLGMVATAATLVFALACGGSSNSSTSTGSYKGSLDGSVVTSTSDIVVAAYDANGSLKATAQTSDGTLTAGAAAGEDHFFTLTGLTEGSTYKIKAFRLGTPVGGLQSVDSVTDKVELLSTVATVNSESGSSPIVLSKTTVTTRQMNAFTTYIAQKIATVSATALASTMSAAFGGNTVDLASIRNTGGALVLGTQSLSQLGADTTVTDAVSYIATAAYTAASVPSSQISAVSASLQAAITSLSTATSADLASLAATIFAAINTAITDPAFLTAFNNNLALVAPTVKTLVDFAGGSFSTLTTTAGVSGFSDNVKTAVTNSTKVTSFELVDATYGSRSGTTFTVGTLAPVFKIAFDKAVTSTSNLVTLTLKNKASGQTYNLSTATSLVDQKLSTSSNTLYLYVKKAASTTLAAGELEPGSSYDFTLTAVSNAVSFDNSFSYTGTVNTRTVTITYPSTGYDTSVVKIDGFGGVSTSAVYYLHSSVDLTVNSSKTDYGFFGGSSYLNASTTGSASQLSVSGVVAGTATGTAKAGIVTVSGLSTGTSYTVTLSDDQGLVSGSTKITDYPKTLKLDVQ